MDAIQPTLFSLHPGIVIPDDVPPSNKYLTVPTPGNRLPIETSDECIIFDQFYYVEFDNRHKPIWYALVQCPRCEQVFMKRRSAMQRIRHSYCIHCGFSLSSLKDLPENNECIVIDHLLDGYEYAAALVECPLCHKQFPKSRGNIFKDRHTVCFKCAAHRANSGPNHYNWRGGCTNDYYYDCDWVYLSTCIRARDSYQCQYPDCLETRYTQGRALSVHHIVPFNESFDNDPRNLISLCQSHHLWADWNLDESIPMFDNLIMMMYGPDY